MTFGSGNSSLYSITSSSSLSAPTTPSTNLTLGHGVASQPKPSLRRELVSAPAPLKRNTSRNGEQPVHSRKSSFNSSSTSSNEVLTIKSANAATKKIKRARSSTTSSPKAGRGLDISLCNVYATTDRSGRARAGSGSGASAGCVLM